MEIAKITGIEEDVLDGQSIFDKSIATRMSWAAFRQTTRAEDMAYCLMGIFEVNMPMLYGEGRDRAFIRLQEEILKSSDDRSIFYWTEPSASRSTLRGVLASSPAQFLKCKSPIRSDGAKPYRMTNKGLKIHLPLIPRPGFKEEYYAILSSELFAQGWVCGITLKKIDQDTYSRIDVSQLWSPNGELLPEKAQHSTIFLGQKQKVPRSIDLYRIAHVVFDARLFSLFLEQGTTLRTAKNGDRACIIDREKPLLTLPLRQDLFPTDEPLSIDVQSLVDGWTGRSVVLFSRSGHGLRSSFPLLQEIGIYATIKLVYNELVIYVDYTMIF